jgi:hypothetical protein
MLANFSTGIFAQEKSDKNQRDRQTNETTMTGCLSKDSAGFVLTDEKSGGKTIVTGAPDLKSIPLTTE